MTDIVVKKTEQLKGEVCVPASKSYTQRMLIAASLSEGTSKIGGPLVSEDTDATLRAVKALGATVSASESCWTVTGALPLHGAKDPIDCGESGATLRFMIPIATLASGPSTFTVSGRLAERPIEPLLNSLRQLGAEVQCGEQGSVLLVRVKGGGIRGGKAVIRGDVSSQFVSGLLFACPKAQSDTEIVLSSPLESKEYVLMTKKVLEEHRVAVSIAEDFSVIRIKANQVYAPVDGRVPGDFSSAAFLLAAGAITRSAVRLCNLDAESVQGDRAILTVLKQMGVKGMVCKGYVDIAGEGAELEPLNVDARDIPDLVPVCAVLGCFANGTSRIFNAERLRLKESDRLNSLQSELTKLGADVTVDSGSLTVNGPAKLHGAIVDPHNDHRIAMACAVAGIRAEGKTTIENAECVRKSYPKFFNDLRSLGVDVVGGELFR